MKPTKYVLLKENGYIYLRFYADGLLKGYCNIEAVQFLNGKSLPGLRKQGTKIAKRWNVPFTDLTEG